MLKEYAQRACCAKTSRNGEMDDKNWDVFLDTLSYS